MKFEDKVRKHLRKPKAELEKKIRQMKIPKEGVESFKRENLIAIIESKVGTLSSVPFNKIDTLDLFKLANALQGNVRK